MYLSLLEVFFSLSEPVSGTLFFKCSQVTRQCLTRWKANHLGQLHNKQGQTFNVGYILIDPGGDFPDCRESARLLDHQSKQIYYPSLVFLQEHKLLIGVICNCSVGTMATFIDRHIKRIYSNVH